jgi:hypothetical protein
MWSRMVNSPHSMFYGEHSRVVHVHDPVRTIFDASDAMPAACGSFSDNAHALQPFKISKVFHIRVVLPAAYVRKTQASACESERSSWCLGWSERGSTASKQRLASFLKSEFSQQAKTADHPE